MKRFFAIAAMSIATFSLPGQSYAQHHKSAPADAPAPNGYDYANPEVQPAKETLDLSMYARIRDEGLNHSRVMDYATALFDDIGPRLTGSPNMAKGKRVDPRPACRNGLFKRSS